MASAAHLFSEMLQRRREMSASLGHDGRRGDIVIHRRQQSRTIEALERIPEIPPLGGVAAGPTLEQIAEEAYAIFESRGRGEGHALEDWLEAERRLFMTADTSN